MQRDKPVMDGQQRLTALGIIGATVFLTTGIVMYGNNWNDANARGNITKRAETEVQAESCSKDRDLTECQLIVQMQASCEKIANDDDEANCMQRVFGQVQAQEEEP
jgi:hypothetical protein